jgi:hypothetical protein
MAGTPIFSAAKFHSMKSKSEILTLCGLMLDRVSNFNSSPMSDSVYHMFSECYRLSGTISGWQTVSVCPSGLLLCSGVNKLYVVLTH